MNEPVEAKDALPWFPILGAFVGVPAAIIAGALYVAWLIEFVEWLWPIVSPAFASKWFAP